MGQVWSCLTVRAGASATNGEKHRKRRDLSVDPKPSSPSEKTQYVDLDDTPCGQCVEDNELCRGHVAGKKSLPCIRCEQLGRECTPAGQLLLAIRHIGRTKPIEEHHKYEECIRAAARIIRDADEQAAAGEISFDLANRVRAGKVTCRDEYPQFVVPHADISPCPYFWIAL